MLGKYSSRARLVLKCLLWSIIGLLAANLVRSIRQQSVNAQTSSAQAYTVLRTEKGFDKAGVLKYTNHYVEAVRSDGSRMWKGSTDDVDSRKIYFANGDEIRTNELLARKSTYLGVHAGPLIRSPQSSCMDADEQRAGWMVAGEDSVGGHRAVRLVSASNTRTMSAWYAVDAGCALLKLRLQHESGLTEHELAALIVAEPDVSLFQVPPSFVETPPSALMDACAGASAACASKAPQALKDRIDKSYLDARARALR